MADFPILEIQIIRDDAIVKKLFTDEKLEDVIRGMEHAFAAFDSKDELKEWNDYISDTPTYSRRRPGLLSFEYEDCRETFYIPAKDYRGQFDHPPSVPICPACSAPD